MEQKNYFEIYNCFRSHEIKKVKKKKKKRKGQRAVLVKGVEGRRFNREFWWRAFSGGVGPFICGPETGSVWQTSPASIS